METLSRLTEAKLIPLLRPVKPALSLPLLAALCSGGIGAAEFSMHVPHSPEAIRSGSRLFPDLVLGAGDVTDVTTAQIAIQSGAHYLSSPGYSPAIATLCRQQEILYLPQCLSPSELLEAKLDQQSACGLFAPHLWGNDCLVAELVSAFPGLSTVACRVPYTDVQRMLLLPGIVACTVTDLPVDSPQELAAVCEALSRQVSLL